MTKLKQFIGLSGDKLKNSEFSSFLKEEREARELTKAALARKIEVSPVMITRYERNIVSPSEDKLNKLIEVFESKQGNEDNRIDEVRILEEKLRMIEAKIDILEELRTMKKKQSD